MAGWQALGFSTAFMVLRVASADAFPLVDPSNQGSVPTGTELAAPDAQDLQHQLQLANGFGAPAGGGWIFVPRLDLQALLTDNVLQVNEPRRADLATYIAPGFSLAGDTSRLQLNISYAPTLAIYADNGDLNALTQQFTGTGLLTVAPDWAYIDIRGLSGVHSLYGGFGGLGTVGASPAAVTGTAATIPSLAGNSLGLNKENEVQATSFSISPYLLHQFGDWGTGKLGYSFSVSQSADVSGFATSPLPTQGANAQTLISNEEIGHFATGDVLGRLQNAIDFDLLESTIRTGAGYTNSIGGPAIDVSGSPVALPQSQATSDRALISDRISYSLNRELTVFATIGHENIIYTNLSGQTVTGVTIGIGANGQLVPVYHFGGPSKTSINDATWSFGATLTPGPNSQLTVSYGHLNGFDSLTVNGFYNVTSRTTLTASYGSTYGTQIENLQNQLGQATVNGSGTLVNAANGGALFGNINALGVADGVFRTDTLAVGGQTNLDRDIITANLLLARQTEQGVPGTTASTVTTFNLQWVHQIHPDLTFSAVAAYSLQDQGAAGNIATSYNHSLAASVALQYQISETLTGSLRYSFFDQTSPVAAFRIYQNVLILGLSKTF